MWDIKNVQDAVEAMNGPVAEGEFDETIATKVAGYMNANEYPVDDETYADAMFAYDVLTWTSEN